VYAGRLSGGGSFPDAHSTLEAMREKGIDLGLAKQFQVIRQTGCSRMRLAETKYNTVDGYCVLDGSAGWLMVPSIDLFEGYCTTLRFSEGPWSETGSDKDEG